MNSNNNDNECALCAGVEVVCLGIVVPRQSERSTIERASHYQTTCILEFSQYILLDDSSCPGDLLTECSYILGSPHPLRHKITNETLMQRTGLTVLKAPYSVSQSSVVQLYCS